MVFTNMNFRPPKVRIKHKTQKSGRVHDYYVSSWRDKDGKPVTFYVGPVSIGTEEALKIALVAKLGTITIPDLTFQHEDVLSKEIIDFVERHERLGTLSQYPSDIFTARYRGLLASVVIFETPLAYSKMLGSNTKDVERLISRGASASWAPKNLGSKLLSFAIDWCVQNTPYKLFYGYSDPAVKENGTIYQASNFYYLGQTFGSGYRYCIEPARDKWVSSRSFRSRSMYKRLARANDIEWNPAWQDGDRVLFECMPEDIAIRLKQLSKDFQKSCAKKKNESKRKYAYVAGKDRRETKKLRSLFLQLNQTYPYPHKEAATC
jgi:hypothetical protein